MRCVCRCPNLQNWKHFVIIDAVGKTRRISQNLIEKDSSTKREFILFGSEFK